MMQDIEQIMTNINTDIKERSALRKTTAILMKSVRKTGGVD